MGSTNGKGPALDFVYEVLLTPDEQEKRGYYTDGELLGTGEIAVYLGVEKSRIARWIATGAMPKPKAKLLCGPVWTIAQADVKLAELYADAGHPHGKTKAGLQRWAQERRQWPKPKKHTALAAA